MRSASCQARAMITYTASTTQYWILFQFNVQVGLLVSFLLVSLLYSDTELDVEEKECWCTDFVGAIVMSIECMYSEQEENRKATIVYQ